MKYFVQTSLILALALPACGGDEFASGGAGGSAGGGTGGNVSGGAGGTSSGGTGAGGTGGSAGTSGAASCKALFASGVTDTGVHTITLAKGIAVDVYCEMGVAGGGWTLVARSSDSDPTGTGFGWKRSSGAVGDANVPYSLDLATNPIDFSEILFAERDGDYGIAQGFVGSVPAGFLQDYASAAYEMQPPPATVVGSCAPAGGVWMLSNVGHTSRTDSFFVRDIPGNDVFGLDAWGWNMGTDMSCQYNAELSNKHGMLFVR